MGLRRNISSNSKKRSGNGFNQRLLINSRITSIHLNIRKGYLKTTDSKTTNNIIKIITRREHNKCNKGNIANKIPKIWAIIHMTNNQNNKLTTPVKKIEEITF
jgi:hypothetical protein